MWERCDVDVPMRKILGRSMRVVQSWREWTGWAGRVADDGELGSDEMEERRPTGLEGAAEGKDGLFLKYGHHVIIGTNWAQTWKLFLRFIFSLFL